MIEIIGSEGITARVIVDSVASTCGTRLLTYELEYPRFIHGEVLTHKMLSKNSASSRAIPVEKMLDLILNNPAMPVHWGKNQSGMSAREELAGSTLEGVKASWIAAMKDAVSFTKVLLGLGLHKQISNRICEPWQRMKTVMTGTEWANFFHLRNHPDAQPEFHELARVMQLAYEQSQPQVLQPGQWHLPYVSTIVGSDGSVTYTTGDGDVLTEDDALKISAACCAQVSYRRLDDTLAAAKRIFSRLIESEPAHASPVEHQGKVMLNQLSFGSTDEWEPGVTHMRRDGSLWSANFRGWIQARQLIANEAKW